MILPVLLWALMIAVVIAGWPLVALLLYGITGADRDGYAMLQYLSGFSEHQKLITRTIFLGLYAYASLLYVKRRYSLPKDVRWTYVICQILSFYIFMVSIFKGYDLTWSLSAVVYSGIPVYLMWLVFSLDKDHKTFFLWFVFIQILLSALVLIFPIFGFLDGGQYKMLEGIYVIEGGALNYAIPDASFIKGSIGRYGVFHNPNALGLYACIAIACGFFLGFSKGTSQKAIGACLLLLGGLCWLNSLTRGPMIFLIMGGLLSVLMPLKQVSQHQKQTRWMLGLLVLIFTMAIGFYGENIFSYLIPTAETDSVYYRYDGYHYGFEAVMSHPLLGVDERWDWSIKSYPHFIALSFAAEYGLLAGVLIAILVFFWGGFLILRGAQVLRDSLGRRSEAALGISLILICWGIAVTNNFAAPVLFWLAMAEAVLLIRVKGYKAYA